MSKIHGKDTYFAIGAAADDTLQDISDHLNSVERSLNRDTAESTGFSPTGGFKTYVAGLKDGTVSVEGQYDGAAGAVDEVLEAIMNEDEPRSWEFGPEGSATGAPRKSGGPNGGGAAGEGALLNTYDISSPIGDVVSFSAEFQITGQQVSGSFA